MEAAGGEAPVSAPRPVLVGYKGNRARRGAGSVRIPEFTISTAAT
jgi:hypothetical protein